MLWCTGSGPGRVGKTPVEMLARGPARLCYLRQPQNNLAHLRLVEACEVGGDCDEPTSDEPDRRIPPISQWVFIGWDRCTRRKMPYKTGTDLSTLQDLLQEQGELSEDWI